VRILDEYCAFNRIYKLDGGLSVGRHKVKDVRAALSEEMARYISSLSLSYGAISPVPNTGGLYTHVLSELLGMPEIKIFEKETVERTLGAQVAEREGYYKKYLRCIESNKCVDKKVLFVDEALLSGLTVQLISKACKENGIDNYSFAFMSPVNHLSCPFGHIVNTSRIFPYLNNGSYEERIENFRKIVGAQEIIFLPYESFAMKVGGDSVCKLCFHNCGGGLRT